MILRMGMAFLAAAMFLGTATGCAGSYEPRKNGVCNPGRTWVPPQKNDDGKWKAGYCSWAEQK